MSIFSKIGKAIGRVAKSPLVATALSVIPATAPIGLALTAAQRARSMIKGPGAPVEAVFPGAGPMSMMPMMGMQSTMGAMPGVGRALPQIGRAIGFGAGVAVAQAGRIARGAAALCSKHPQWCSTIGGVAAVAALMESGQLPVPKRRRGRGLTPRDLRSFRRVARLIRVFAPTVRRIPHRALHVRGTGITHA